MMFYGKKLGLPLLSRKVRVGALAFLLTALAGCGDKHAETKPEAAGAAPSAPVPTATPAPAMAPSAPVVATQLPGCADPRVTQTIVAAVLDEARGFTKGDTPERMASMETYYTTVQFAVDQITTDGYDAEAKRRTCQGRLTFSDVRAQQLEGSINYAVQALEDKPGEFLMRLANKTSVTGAVISRLATYFADDVQSGAPKPGQTVDAVQPAQAASASSASASGA